MVTGIAIVGCGFVADKYMWSVPHYPDLKLIGVYDRDATRAATFGAHHGVARYGSLDELLGDARVAIVLNLTNPRSHYDVSKACLQAGKHVYSEKPLAMELDQARDLVSMASARGLWISAAPCTLLGETAQSIWRALREGQLGQVRVAYAELDDGLVHLMPYKKWISDSGAPWPYVDEFEIGCTLEHAGYYLTWLAAFFGPAKSLTAYASVQIPDKVAGTPLAMSSPDFSVACMQFESGVSARLTCSILAPHDRGLTVVGDQAVLNTHDCWQIRSPVTIRRLQQIRRRQFYLPWGRRYRLLSSGMPRSVKQGGIEIDWLRGVADLAYAVRDGRRPRLAPDFCLHVTELALGIHSALRRPGSIPITTRFEPLEPMLWAA